MDKLTNFCFDEVDWNARLQLSGGRSEPSLQGSEPDEEPRCEDVLGIVGHISLVTLNDEIIWPPRRRSSKLNKGPHLDPSSGASDVAGKPSSNSNSQERGQGGNQEVKGLSLAPALQNYADCIERDAKGDGRQRRRDSLVVLPDSGGTGRNFDEKSSRKREHETSTIPPSNLAPAQDDSRKIYPRQHGGAIAETELQPEWEPQHARHDTPITGSPALATLESEKPKEGSGYNCPNPRQVGCAGGPPSPLLQEAKKSEVLSSELSPPRGRKLFLRKVSEPWGFQPYQQIPKSPNELSLPISQPANTKCPSQQDELPPEPRKLRLLAKPLKSKTNPHLPESSLVQTRGISPGETEEAKTTVTVTASSPPTTSAPRPLASKKEETSYVKLRPLATIPERDFSIATETLVKSPPCQATGASLQTRSQPVGRQNFPHQTLLVKDATSSGLTGPLSGEGVPVEGSTPNRTVKHLVTPKLMSRSAASTELDKSEGKKRSSQPERRKNSAKSDVQQFSFAPSYLAMARGNAAVSEMASGKTQKQRTASQDQKNIKSSVWTQNTESYPKRGSSSNSGPAQKIAEKDLWVWQGGSWEEAVRASDRDDGWTTVTGKKAKQKKSIKFTGVADHPRSLSASSVTSRGATAAFAVSSKSKGTDKSKSLVRQDSRLEAAEPTPHTPAQKDTDAPKMPIHLMSSQPKKSSARTTKDLFPTLSGREERAAKTSSSWKPIKDAATARDITQKSLVEDTSKAKCRSRSQRKGSEEVKSPKEGQSLVRRKVSSELESWVDSRTPDESNSPAEHKSSTDSESPEECKKSQCDNPRSQHVSEGKPESPSTVKDSPLLDEAVVSVGQPTATISKSAREIDYSMASQTSAQDTLEGRKKPISNGSGSHPSKGGGPEPVNEREVSGSMTKSKKKRLKKKKKKAKTLVEPEDESSGSEPWIGREYTDDTPASQWPCRDLEHFSFQPDQTPVNKLTTFDVKPPGDQDTERDEKPWDPKLNYNDFLMNSAIKESEVYPGDLGIVPCTHYKSRDDLMDCLLADVHLRRFKAHATKMWDKDMLRTLWRTQALEIMPICEYVQRKHPGADMVTLIKYWLNTWDEPPLPEDLDDQYLTLDEDDFSDEEKERFVRGLKEKHGTKEWQDDIKRKGPSMVKAAKHMMRKFGVLADPDKIFGPDPTEEGEQHQLSSKAAGKAPARQTLGNELDWKGREPEKETKNLEWLSFKQVLEQGQKAAQQLGIPGRPSGHLLSSIRPRPVDPIMPGPIEIQSSTNYDLPEELVEKLEKMLKRGESYRESQSCNDDLAAEEHLLSKAAPRRKRADGSDHATAGSQKKAPGVPTDTWDGASYGERSSSTEQGAEK